MLFYCNDITPRIKYVVSFICMELTGGAVRITNDKNEFLNYGAAKINYSNEKIGTDEFWIKPYGLLFEKTIHLQEVDCFELNGHKAFFKTEGDHPFDIFAATFYLLSRYEEYLPHQKDSYGRYAHENSLAFKENFLNVPLINIWVEQFRKLLNKIFPSFTIQHSPFTFLPTYDIDEAYSYKYKRWWRTTGALCKALLKGQWSRITERRKVLSGKLQDPYDSFDWMDDLHQHYQLKPRYFFLIAEKTGKYDRNILPKEKALQQLIVRHAAKYETGVHPSWQSGDDALLIKSEIQSIENIIGKKVTSSRQHFIRLSLPQTFRQLVAAGIKEEFSMGYGSINGFRASVASTFYWYDLEKEETTDLLLYPFCYMDANSYYEARITPQEALKEMQYYYQEVKRVNGLLVTLWHNTYLGTDRMYKGWREVYEQFIREVTT
jgi:hypothetical protein